MRERNGLDCDGAFLLSILLICWLFSFAGLICWLLSPAGRVNSEGFCELVRLFALELEKSLFLSLSRIVPVFFSGFRTVLPMTFLSPIGLPMREVLPELIMVFGLPAGVGFRAAATEGLLPPMALPMREVLPEFILVFGLPAGAVFRAAVTEGLLPLTALPIRAVLLGLMRLLELIVGCLPALELTCTEFLPPDTLGDGLDPPKVTLAG